MELLCERHATSKLVEVGDLKRVGTFGFRGEALASCSQVARVEVVTRSREAVDGEVAWKASYLAGKLCGDPTPVAGNFGTIINVKDLFYGHRVRREALLNSSEEYQKIVQVIQSYALNQSGRCAFILSKRRDRVEMQTSLADSAGQVVKNLWNEELGGALLPFKVESDGHLGIEDGSGGWATRTTFHKLKSPQVIIFLNGRLIEHAVLRRALLQAFSMHLPTSPPAHPFIYLKLELKGSRVDVNVHPSKRQVFFLDEEDIVRRVVGAVDGGILQRQYETQSLKPIIVDRARAERSEPVDGCKKVKTQNPPALPKISTLYPSQRILTDHRNHRIDTFLFHAQSQSANPETGGDVKWSQVAARKGNRGNGNVGNSSISGSSQQSDDSFIVAKVEPVSGITADESIGTTSMDLASTSVDTSMDAANTSLVVTGNTSIILDSQSQSQSSQSQPAQPAQPQAKVTSSNDQLCRLLQSSLPVGLVDSKWCLLQSGTNLLLCDMDRLNYDMFFSLLSAAAAPKRAKFDVEIGVRGLFEDGEIGGEAVEVIRRNCRSFSDEFGIVFEASIDDGDDIILKRIPSVLPGQRCPSRRFLETFIQRLCLLNHADPNHLSLSSDSGSVSGSVLKEMALLYSLIDTEEWSDWEDYVKFVVLTGYRDSDAKFTTGGIACDPPVQIITDTETLYKSFERC